MPDAFMLAVLSPEQFGVLAFVGHERAALRQLFGEDWAKRLGVHDGDMMRAHAAAALHQREHCLFARRAAPNVLALAAVFVLLKTTDINLVDLNRLALTAEW